MGKRALPLSSSGDNVNHKEITSREGQPIVSAQTLNSGTRSSEPEVDGSLEKHPVEKLYVSSGYSRVKGFGTNKVPICPPTTQRKLSGPVIIHSSPPEVIQVDPSSFKRMVQELTGSSTTRSRCKKRRPQSANNRMQTRTETSFNCAMAAVETVRAEPSTFSLPVQTVTGLSRRPSHSKLSETQGFDNLMQAQTETQQECAFAAGMETELYVHEDILLQTSSDDEESITTESTLEKALPSLPATSNEVSCSHDESPRSPSRFSSLCHPIIAGYESEFYTTTPASYSQLLDDHSCPELLSEHVISCTEPLWDSYISPYTFPRDASFCSLSDVPLLSPSGLDGFFF